jgi:acyl CoA:acetate/3-ketoacid CoA transferase beta subunit
VSAERGDGVALDEVCAVACAEAFRGDGEIMASPMLATPTLGARLARATFEPDLLLSDGEAFLVANDLALAAPGAAPPVKVIEGWIPFRSVFDTLWGGRRHVFMGASQIDRFGNQNIACIGPWDKPKAQLLGMRGAPGNTANHATSYWVPNHTPRVFVEEVDVVSGIGYRRAAGAGPWVEAHHEIRRVVSNLGVFDFETAEHAMRLRSVHPGVTVAEVVAATGFELVIPPGVPTSRLPTDEELRLIRTVLDPGGLRKAEFSS